MKLLDSQTGIYGMKTIRFFYLLLFSALAIPALTDAQIADNDASMNVLAVQCAVSSGFSADEYEDYCRRLAKTLSLLSSAQQTRVFGYLPMPGAASLGDSGPETSAATGSTESSNQRSAETGARTENSPTTGSNEVGSKDTAPATTPTQSNGLLDMVGRFNSLFDGTGSTPNDSRAATSSGSLETMSTLASATSSVAAPVIGNSSTVSSITTPTADSATTATSNTNSGSSGGISTSQPAQTSGGWSSLMAWFAAAEAAYKSGTLSSFLKGGI